ncbi:MAG: hypothetical protein IKN96_00560 [Oscillibacter sp.]|nr:hypothetical protein [Oscillibacter sp.]
MERKRERKPETEMIPYAEIKRFTLELIDRHSVAGETVSPAYNNQSDYIGRIPNLINAALTQIALTVSPAREPPPGRLPVGAADAYELDAPYPWAQCACYYAAAYLVMDDSEFAYAALMNEYEAFLRRLSGRISAEFADIREAYAFPTGGG